MHRKGLVIGILILMLGVNIGSSFAGDADVKTIPSSNSITATTGNIITVDDEPGDADFTSIKEAVNYSSPGDTIEVYSGTYPEQGIRIVKDNIRLLGISHELGEGDDSGKPFIKGNGTETVIKLIASNVTVSNFTIENLRSSGNFVHCIRVGTYWPDDLYRITISDCIISDCIIRNSTHYGIWVEHMGGHISNIIIINNHISQCKTGIDTGIDIRSKSFIITGNVITDCGEIGISLFRCNLLNISGNRIRRCRIGIQFGGENTIVYGNDIESCGVGIQGGGWGNIITKNNFKNYSRIGIWFAGTFGERFIEGFKKSRWIGNYWDTWSGVGPKIIPGMKVLWIRRLFFLIPWFVFDWHPAQEPYDIGV